MMECRFLFNFLKTGAKFLYAKIREKFICLILIISKLSFRQLMFVMYSGIDGMGNLPSEVNLISTTLQLLEARLI